MKKFLVCTVAAAALAACGQKTDKAEPAQPAASESPAAAAGAPTPPEQAAISLTPDGGVSVSGGAAPAFAPHYPGGQTLTTMNANDNGKQGGIYAFTTGDSADKVLDYYRGKAEAAGLKSQGTMTGQGNMVYGAGGPAGDVAVTIAEQGPGVNYVQVTWSAN